MPQPPKKVPVDTVALKKTIAKDSTKGADMVSTSAALERSGNKAQANAAYSAGLDANVSAAQGRATLDKARTGQIPATPAAVKRPVNRDATGAPIHAKPDSDG